jgi:methionine-rich copper-binding protein CopC
LKKKSIIRIAVPLAFVFLATASISAQRAQKAEGILRYTEPKGSESAFAAHALLIESTPASNSSVAGPDIEIRLRFNSRIDEARSRLTLVFPDHTTYRLEIHKQAADTLTSRATGLKRGAHSLQWQVLASDGHVTRGEVPFAVG